MRGDDAQRRRRQAVARDADRRDTAAARIGNACRIAENDAALNDLRQYVADEKLDGTVSIGGRDVKLA